MSWKDIVKADEDPKGHEEDEFDPSGSTHGRKESKPKPVKPMRHPWDKSGPDIQGDSFRVGKEPTNISQPPGSCDNHPGCQDKAEFFCSDCCTKYCADCYNDFGGPGSGGRGHPRAKMAGNNRKSSRYDGSSHEEWCNQAAIDERERKKRGL